MAHFPRFKEARRDILFELWTEGAIKESVTKIFENGCEDMLKKFSYLN